MTDPNTRPDSASLSRAGVGGPAGVDRLAAVGVVIRELAEHAFPHLVDHLDTAGSDDRPDGGEPR